jgi:MacB-like periplasmic core domain
MLLKMLPVKEPERLALFRSIAPNEFSTGGHAGYSDADAAGRIIRTSFPYQSFQRMRERQSEFSDVFAFGDVSLNVNAGGQADVASGQAVSGNYYAGLGVRAMLGRTLTDEDDRAAASPVAALSHRYWQRR